MANGMGRHAGLGNGWTNFLERWGRRRYRVVAGVDRPGRRGREMVGRRRSVSSIAKRGKCLIGKSQRFLRIPSENKKWGEEEEMEKEGSEEDRELGNGGHC